MLRGNVITDAIKERTKDQQGSTVQHANRKISSKPQHHPRAACLYQVGWNLPSAEENAHHRSFCGEIHEP
jgi:hypothetical protein